MSTDFPESPTEPIGLDDVLEASFLTSDTSETEGNPTEDVDMSHFNRWDLIPVGAFRQTREAASTILGGAILSTPPGSSAWPDPPRPDGFPLDAVMLSSPPLWQEKVVESLENDKTSARIDLDTPMLLPQDGERTPTHSPVDTSSGGSNASPNKTRRESRREKKLKRRSLGTVHQKHQHPHPQHHQHHHHQHQHYPNMKSRSSGAFQRAGGIGPSSNVPPLSL